MKTFIDNPNPFPPPRVLQWRDLRALASSEIDVR